MARLSRLIGSGGDEFDDFDAAAIFWWMTAWMRRCRLQWLWRARGGARPGLSQCRAADAGRKACARAGVAIAARELMRNRGSAGVRALPRLARSAARVAARGGATPQRAAQTVRRHLPHTARQVAQDRESCGG